MLLSQGLEEAINMAIKNPPLLLDLYIMLTIIYLNSLLLCSFIEPNLGFANYNTGVYFICKDKIKQPIYGLENFPHFLELFSS